MTGLSRPAVLPARRRAAGARPGRGGQRGRRPPVAGRPSGWCSTPPAAWCSSPPWAPAVRRSPSATSPGRVLARTGLAIDVEKGPDVVLPLVMDTWERAARRPAALGGARRRHGRARHGGVRGGPHRERPDDGRLDRRGDPADHRRALPRPRLPRQRRERDRDRRAPRGLRGRGRRPAVHQGLHPDRLRRHRGRRDPARRARRGRRDRAHPGPGRRGSALPLRQHRLRRLRGQRHRDPARPPRPGTRRQEPGRRGGAGAGRATPRP